MTTVESPFKYLIKMFESGDPGAKAGNSSAKAQSGITLHERLLSQLNELYNHETNGLIEIGRNVNIQVLPPKKRVTVLLIGNHSAGKSSFINWYIEDTVQKTGMAIETQSFTVVASGKKRETLMGPATAFLYPHLKPLGQIEGVMDYLNAEISTSKNRQFPMVTFIDTPGLVDGGMEYPYNVNDAILFLGKTALEYVVKKKIKETKNHRSVADLIFVFFDPIGLALCKRTMEVVEKINSQYPEKLNFYLSKSDEIRKQTDKQKIMMQITQEVCRHSGLNRSGFTMPAIFIPTLSHHSNSSQKANPDPLNNQAEECANELHELCKQIDQTINRTVQIALSNLDKDIRCVLQAINHRLSTNKKYNNIVLEDNNVSFYYVLASIVMLALTALLCSTGLRYLVERFGLEYTSSITHIPLNVLLLLIEPVTYFLSFSMIDSKNHVYIVFFIILCGVIYHFTVKICLKPTLARRDVRELEKSKIFVMNYMSKKKVELIQEYLEDSYDL